MAETLLDELKRWVDWKTMDEEALRALHPLAAPRFPAISAVFYDRILRHPGARAAMQGGDEQIARLRHSLEGWLGRLLMGPWDETYFESRCRIGRVHVRIDLPQHHMFGAMNVVRTELAAVAEEATRGNPRLASATHLALGRVLDLEIAIMLHTYREDLLARQARIERMSTLGQLVGSISHDLRNPLAVIEASLHVLRSSASPDARVTRQLDRIGTQVGVASGIIENLLDLFRDRPIAREPVELEAVLASAAEAVQRPSGVGYTAQGMTGLCVEGDSGQLRQVLVNLLTNAVEAASPRGQVTVQGSRAEGSVLVAVEDDGAGIDPAVVARLFEPLVTTKVRGVGLGLTLVKRIVERHGGSVYHEGRPGGGARFVVRLPAPPLPAP